MIRFAGGTIAVTVLLASFAVSQSTSTQTSPNPGAAAQGPPVSSPTAASSTAQEFVPRVQVFGGYSLLHGDTGGVNGMVFDVDLRQPGQPFGVRRNFNGWNAEAQYNFTRWVGLVADVAGYTGSPITRAGTNTATGLPNQTSYSFMAGPVITYRAYRRVTPYLHALFGYSRSSLSASTITGVLNPVTSAATTYNDFAVALGAGIDYKLGKRLALRLGELDWYHTSLDLNKYYGSAYGPGLFQGLSTNERNLRFSTGVVINF